MALAHRLRLYFERNERMLAPAFFAAGFVFDVLTLGRIDSWLTIGQQAAYLALITVVLAHAFIEEGREPAPAGHGRLAGGYYRWRMPAVHFLLGALLNLYTIFYFKSSSLGVSFAFMAALVLLLLANELPRFKALGPAFRFAL
ncbi:MAG TPA: hypothetical protein VEB41_04580, partial [Burkholderiales bacterium]|nr:hypothetical protein [Burkholderiales bacterium]